MNLYERFTECKKDDLLTQIGYCSAKLEILRQKKLEDKEKITHRLIDLMIAQETETLKELQTCYALECFSLSM